MKQTVDPVYENLLYLGRRFHPRSRRIRGFVDVSPLVDAALLLFLFFLIQSSFVLQPGVFVDLPGLAFESGTEYGSMVVTLSREKLLLFNDEWTDVGSLEDRLREAAAAHPGEPLLIQADEQVTHASLVRIYDIAWAAGIQEVVLAGSIHRSSASEEP